MTAGQKLYELWREANDIFCIEVGEEWSELEGVYQDIWEHMASEVGY